jgi:Ca2+-binding RTX toxin-like protein
MFRFEAAPPRCEFGCFPRPAVDGRPACHLGNSGARRHVVFSLTSGDDIGLLPSHEEDSVMAKHVNPWGGTYTDDDTGGDLWGSWYNDTIFAHGGKDHINADDGDDKVYGGDGDDYIYGADGNDKLYGDDDDDYLSGDAGNDIVDGGEGHDIVLGGRGNDTLRGGADDDYLSDTSGQDKLYGGSGTDTLSYQGFEGKIDVTLNGESQGVSRQFVQLSLTPGAPKQWFEASPDEVYSIENVIGSNGDDRIEGDGNGNDIDGGNGADKIYGRGGNDDIFGGMGDDTIVGGGGYDIMQGYGGADNFVFNDGEFTTINIDLLGNRRIDTIKDLDWNDTVDFSNIDADTTTAGNQRFHKVTGGLTGQAAELYIHRTEIGDYKDIYLIEGDVDGNGRADFMVEVHQWNDISATYIF